MVWAVQAESPAPVLVSALETSSSGGGGGVGGAGPNGSQEKPSSRLCPRARGIESPSCSCSVVPAPCTWKEAKCN